jgi:hypothetical protein
MNDMESQLAELLKAAVADPPDNRVTVTAVRHQRTRRQTAAAVGAVIAIAVLGVTSVGLIRGLASPPPAAGPALPAGVPRYYAEEAFGHGGQYRTVMRATATGTVTAAIRCPLPHAISLIGPIAADKYQRFFMVCTAFRGNTLTDARIYQFRVTSSGKVRSYAPVRGGDLGAVQSVHLAVSPDGSQIAVAVIPSAGSVTTEDATQARIVVINTRTAARAIWRNPPAAPGAIRFSNLDISFAASGRELVFLGTRTCGPTGNQVQCPHWDQQVRALAPASGGGRLSAGRILLRRIGSQTNMISDAVVSADGSTLTIVTQSFQRGSDQGPSTLTVSQILLATRTQQVIYHANGTHGLRPLVPFNPDYSGRHFLIGLNGWGPGGAPTGGWINHGRLVKLKPFNTSVYEAW